MKFYVVLLMICYLELIQSNVIPTKSTLSKTDPINRETNWLNLKERLSSLNDGDERRVLTELFRRIKNALGIKRKKTTNRRMTKRAPETELLFIIASLQRKIDHIEVNRRIILKFIADYL